MVDVPAEIDAPHERAGPTVVGVDLVRVRARHAPPRIDLPDGMLDDEIVGAITVEVANADAIDGADVVAHLQRAIRRGLRVCGNGHAVRRALLAAIHDQRDPPGVFALARGGGIEEIGRAPHRLRREPLRRSACRRPVHVEGALLGIGVEQPPRQVHARAFERRHHEAAIQSLGNPRGRPPQRRARRMERIHRVEAQIRRNLLGRQRPQLAVVVSRRPGGLRLRRRRWRRLLLRVADGDSDRQGQPEQRGTRLHQNSTRALS